MGSPLARLLAPGSVCLVGASADPAKQSGRPLLRLTQHGFSGDITIVNPARESINGVPSYPSIDALPSTPDVAVLMVAAERVPAAVRACGERGTPYALVLSSGFEEVGEGDGLARELRTAVDETGIRVVGPNSVGLWSLPSSLVLTLGTVAARASLLDGPVTVLSQSGSIGGATVRLLQDRGVGCRQFVSVGNETDLTVVDFLEHAVLEGESTVVALFVEGLRDGHRMRELVEQGRRQGMRFVALRAGASDAGRAATATHTGKIATAARVYEGLFEQCGVVTVDTVADLIDACEVLARYALPPTLEADGDVGLGVLAISGGSRALIADACARRGVPMATFADATESRLRELLPPVGYPRNPVDVDGLIFDPDGFRETIGVVGADPRTEAMLIQYANQSEEQIRDDMDFLRSHEAGPSRLVAVSFIGRDVDPSLKQALAEKGILYATDPDAAVKHIDWLYRARRPVVERVERATASVPPAVSADWSSTMDWLESAGLDVPRWRIVDGEAGRPEDDLAYPVVAKALPEQSAHKSELGLVHVDLRGLAELERAIASIRGVIGPDAPVLVQEMIVGGVEVLLAARDDPDWGPVLAIGTGGVAVELYDDVAYLGLPASDEEIVAAIAKLKLGRLLDGFRRDTPRDLAAVVAAAQAVARLFEGLPAGSREVEVNPLCVLDEGRGAFAVDVLVAGATMVTEPVA